MPDDIGITPGTGATVAADLIGGALYQRVKIGVGPDGTAVDASSVAPLPIIGLLSKSISATLTVTSGAYSIADVVGGLITFAAATHANAGHTKINSIKLAGVAALAYELWLFNADIATPAADNAPFTLVAADVVKCLGVIPIAAADYYAPQSAFNVATVRNVNLVAKAGAATTSIFAYLKATATTTPGTTTLTLTLDVTYLD